MVSTTRTKNPVSIRVNRGLRPPPGWSLAAISPRAFTRGAWAFSPDCAFGVTAVAIKVNPPCWLLDSPLRLAGTPGCPGNRSSFRLNQSNHRGSKRTAKVRPLDGISDRAACQFEPMTKERVLIDPGLLSIQSGQMSEAFPGILAVHDEPAGSLVRLENQNDTAFS